jgi:hypothetical protein
MVNYVGKYFSHKYIRKNILKQSDRDMEEIDKQISEEGSDTETLDIQTDTKTPVKSKTENSEIIDSTKDLLNEKW